MNPTPTRRRFLAAAAAPLAASPALAGSTHRCEADAELLDAARAYGRLVPAWTEAARAEADGLDPDATRRFDALDRSYDAAKRHLIRLMRQADRPVVVDRDTRRLYVDCSPAGSHEDIDRNLPEHAVVRVVPLVDSLD